MSFSLLGLALFSVVAAQQTSIRMYMPDSGRKDGVYVSLIDVQSGLTTASIDCPYNSDLGPCWMDEKTITYAPSSLVYTHTFNGHSSYSIDYVWSSTINCDMNQENERATCIYRVTSTRTATEETRTFTQKWDHYTTDEFWATVTANAKALTAVDTTTASASSPTPATTSGVPESTTAEAQSGSQETPVTASVTGSGAAETTTSSSTGMGARVAQNAMLLGAAAAVGGVLLV